MDSSYVEEGVAGDEEEGVEGCYCFGTVEGGEGGRNVIWEGLVKRSLHSSFPSLDRWRWVGRSNLSN